MDQEKIGGYIARKRKEQGLTQKQLAARLGLTDKAVSKWERGKSLPDHAVLPELCRNLDISVNEFLSGEDLIVEDYSDKAEENMMVLIEDNKRQTKAARGIIISMGFGFACLLLGLFSMLMSVDGSFLFARFIDLPSLLFVIGTTILVSVAAGTVPDLMRGFQILILKEEFDLIERERADRAMKLVLQTNLLGPALFFACRLVLILPNIPEAELLRKALSIDLLPIVYGLLLDIFLLPVYVRLKN